MPKNIDIELKSFPIELTKAYSSSKKSISKILNQDQIEEWTNIGLKIAHVRKGVRSWELAVKFYQVSPSVSKLIPYNYFYEWMQQGLLISNKSKVATSILSLTVNEQFDASTLVSGIAKAAPISSALPEISTLFKIVTFPDVAPPIVTTSVAAISEPVASLIAN